MSNLSAENKAKMGVAFQAALKYLSPVNDPIPARQCSNICGAISRARDTDECTESGAEYAKQLISQRLGRNVYFTSWVYEDGRVPHGQIRRDSERNQGRKMQETRKAWLKSLVKEFTV